MSLCPSGVFHLETQNWWVTSPHVVPGMARSSATGMVALWRPQVEMAASRWSLLIGCLLLNSHGSTDFDRLVDRHLVWYFGATLVAPLGADVAATKGEKN